MGAARPALLPRHNRRYGGFVVHLGILVIAVGVTGSQAWSVQTETTLKVGEIAKLGGYDVRFDRLDAAEESNHAKVIGTFTVANGRRPAVMQPSKKYYPQESSPIAGVDYWIGLKEDLYLVLGDFTRDGRQATVKIQVNRLVTVIWIGGLILTLGTLLSVMPELPKGACAGSSPRISRRPPSPSSRSLPLPSPLISPKYRRHCTH